MVARDVILKAENIMKKMIFSMLSKENIWNLLSFPDGVDEEKSIERIKYFANSNELTIFISMCADVLSLLSDNSSFCPNAIFFSLKTRPKIYIFLIQFGSIKS